MKKMPFERRFYRFMLFPFLMLIITIIMNLHFISTYEASKQTNTLSNLLDLYDSKGFLKAKVNLPTTTHYLKDTGYLVLKGTLPQSQDDEMYLSSLIKDSSIEIYINDVLRYSFDPTTGLKTRSKLLSGHLVALKLHPDDFGASLEIRLNPTVAFMNYYNIPAFHYGVGYSSQYMIGKDTNNFLCNLSIYLCITLAIIFYCTILIKTKRMEAVRRALTFMFFYTNNFLLFSVFSSRSVFIFFQSPYFIAQMIFILSAILPFSFCFCLQNLYNHDINKSVIGVSKFLIWPLLSLYFISFLLGWDTINKYIVLAYALTLIYITAMITIGVLKLNTVPKYFKGSIVLIAIAFGLNIFEYYYPQYSCFELMTIKQAIPSISAILLIIYSISTYFEKNNVLIKKHVLSDLAYKDALSGVYNRQAYDRRVCQMENGKYYYIMIDINGMKAINDKQGHAKGDEAIKLMGSVIIPMLEKNSACYRIGGDEFAIIASFQDIPAIDSYIQDISVNYYLKSESTFTLSIGYSLIDGDNGLSIEDAIKSADKKMYMEKNRFHKGEMEGKK